MSSEVFKRLMFGIPTAKRKDGEKPAADLRLRVVPQDFERDSVVASKPGDSKNINQDKENEMAQLRRANRIFTWGDAVAEPFIEFVDLKIDSRILANLEKFKIQEPTPIQMQAIPVMMQKRNLLASAPTGSGKTLAFVLPILVEILRLRRLPKYKEPKKLLAIVLEPTRELAKQVSIRIFVIFCFKTYENFVKFSQGLPISTAFFETDEVPKNVDILVSTPNRVVHHLESLKLATLRWLIVDESDRLFETVEGDSRCFRSQLAIIYRACKGKFTHRALFSATFSYEVEEWCKENLDNVAMICVGERNSASSNVTQELVFGGSEQGKVFALKQLFSGKFDPPALVFVQSKERARELVNALSSIPAPFSVASISSEKSKEKVRISFFPLFFQRDSVLEAFRSGRVWVLVCTELIGRGLDLPDVGLVVNFDLPTSLVAYIHRIGRTGRAGRHGRAITFFTEADMKFVRPIATVIHQAGFSVPEYLLKLKPPTRNMKKDLLRRAPRRHHIAHLEKRGEGGRQLKKFPKKNLDLKKNPSEGVADNEDKKKTKTKKLKKTKKTKKTVDSDDDDGGWTVVKRKKAKNAD